MRNYWTEIKKKSRKELEKELIDWVEQLRKIEDECKYKVKMYQGAKTKKEAEEINEELCVFCIARNLLREQIAGIKELLD